MVAVASMYLLRESMMTAVGLDSLKAWTKTLITSNLKSITRHTTTYTSFSLLWSLLKVHDVP